MLPKPHQLKFESLCWDILKETGFVYLAGKPRSGKTLTSILVAERSTRINNVLVLTTKKAIGYPKKLNPDGTICKDKDGKEILVTNSKSKLYIEENEEGWLKTLRLTKDWRRHNYTVTNYEQVGNIKNGSINLKLNPKDYDLVIIDESHNLGIVGKPSNRFRVIKALCWEMPHIHLSGTAIVESPCSIYHQMAISEYNPFPYANFYEFFRQYGSPYYTIINGREINQYDKALPTLLPIIDEFTVYMTQEDAGISKDLQAEDVIHYIELEPETKALYNQLQEQQFSDIYEGKLIPDDAKVNPNIHCSKTLICDSTMKLRTSLHMLESGVSKITEPYLDDKGVTKLKEFYYDLGNNEKIDYMLKTFGDVEGLGIMCHFIGEQKKLSKYFKNARVYSSKADAEGVDLSHLEHFVILSSDYSGAKFIQRKERIINMEGSNTLKVHHLLVKKAISDQVYKRTSKKEDFNNSTYEAQTI